MACMRWRTTCLGRGGGRRRPAHIRYWAPYDEAAWSEGGHPEALTFADAIDRITELIDNDREGFQLSGGIGVPGLDLLWSSHRKLSQAHAELLSAAATTERVFPGTTPTRVPVRVIDLVRSTAHTRALLASIALLVQATNKEDPRVAMPMALREGLVGEGLADAYFASRGWEAVEGIGAFYRPGAGTYGARLTLGNGIDHLFQRTRGDTTEYLIAETKVCKSNVPLDAYLCRQFAEAQLRGAGSESLGTPALTTAWLIDRLHRAFVRGALAPDDYQGATAAAARDELRRVIVLVSCTDYDRASRLHVPDPDRLTSSAADPRPLADEVVTLRVPKPILTSLVADISGARVRGIATFVSDTPRGREAGRESRSG